MSAPRKSRYTGFEATLRAKKRDRYLRAAELVVPIPIWVPAGYEVEIKVLATPPRKSKAR